MNFVKSGKLFLIQGILSFTVWMLPTQALRADCVTWLRHKIFSSSKAGSIGDPTQDDWNRSEDISNLGEVPRWMREGFIFQDKVSFLLQTEAEFWEPLVKFARERGVLIATVNEQLESNLKLVAKFSAEEASREALDHLLTAFGLVVIDESQLLRAEVFSQENSKAEDSSLKRGEHSQEENEFERYRTRVSRTLQVISDYAKAPETWGDGYLQLEAYRPVVDPLSVSEAARLKPRIADGFRGITRLWNSPEILLNLLAQLKREVDQQVLKAAASRAEALEIVRQDYEARHGFGAPHNLATDTRFNRSLLLTREWHQVLSESRPLYDSNLAHSFMSLESGQSENSAAGGQVHRNQWLLVMMALENYPELFESFEGPATELFRELGGDWLIDWKLEASKVDSDLVAAKHLTGGEASLWYYLFDFIGHKARYPNFSSPLYFVEIFHLALEVSRSD
jgi:hypothetical protein